MLPFQVTGNTNLHADHSMPSAVVPSFQQSVPGQAVGLNSNLLGSIKQNHSAVAQLSSSTSFSYSGTSQAGTVDSSEKAVSSKSVCLSSLIFLKELLCGCV